jgi:hypothetical protein
LSENSPSTIPFWGGKPKSFRVHVSKIEAYAKFIGIGDVFDPRLMASCPPWLEFAVIDITKPENQTLVHLYKANKKL